MEGRGEEQRRIGKEEEEYWEDQIRGEEEEDWNRGIEEKRIGRTEDRSEEKKSIVYNNKI